MKRNETTLLSRRSLIGSAVAAIVAGRVGAATLSAPKKSATVPIENFSAAGVSQGVVEVDRVVKTDDEWRKQLSGPSYQVTRHEGTEPAFSGALSKNHDDGLYHCICCDTTVYDSKTKFESGTGWPSFWQPISKKNVVETQDHSFGMVRTAVSCRRCDAHLGHVFEDGPKPTGLRYCMNSVAMKFAPRST